MDNFYIGYSKFDTVDYSNSTMNDLYIFSNKIVCIQYFNSYWAGQQPEIEKSNKDLEWMSFTHLIILACK